MAGSSNFLVVNPNCTNQESDVAYGNDSTRIGGIAFNQILSSLLGNKIFYQSSIGVAALMSALAGKGYSPNDGSANPSTALANLVSVLSNILTNADIPGVPWQTFYANTGPAVTIASPGSSLQILMGTNTYSLAAAPQRVARFLNRGTLQNIGASSLIEFVMNVNSSVTGIVSFSPANNDTWDWEYEVLCAYTGSGNSWNVFPKFTAGDRSTGASIVRMSQSTVTLTGGITSAYSQTNASPSSSGSITQSLQVVTTEN